VYGAHSAGGVEHGQSLDSCPGGEGGEQYDEVKRGFFTEDEGRKGGFDGGKEGVGG